MYFDYTEQNLKTGHYLSNGPKYVIGLMRSLFLKNNTLRTYWPWPWPRLLLHLSGEMATTKTRRTKAASSMAESESESKRSQLLHILLFSVVDSITIAEEKVKLTYQQHQHHKYSRLIIFKFKNIG